jgi:ATP-dependent Clp protease protease subunit
MVGIPYVIEKGPNDQERSYDLYSRMLKDRIIFVRGPIEEGFADVIVPQLLFLESQDAEKDIYMYINSPGGLITEMFAVHDVMQYIKPDVCTVAYGHACSCGSLLLMAGTKGKRGALPNTQIMIHEMAAGYSGKAKDMRNNWEWLDKVDKKLNNMIVTYTGQPLKKVEKDVKLDRWMFPDEAVEYGIIDKVYTDRGE